MNSIALPHPLRQPIVMVVAGIFRRQSRIRARIPTRQKILPIVRYTSFFRWHNLTNWPIMRLALINRDPSKGRSVFQDRKPAQPGKKAAVPTETAAKKWFPLPANFEDPKHSGLYCTLDSGHVSYDIELK